MPRLTQVTDQHADSEVTELFAATKQQLGRVPNLYRTLANAPAALRGYLAFRGALQHGSMDPAVREKIALLVAQLNSCDYCISAHSARGRRLGWSDRDIAQIRRGGDGDPATEALLGLVTQIVHLGGAVTDADLDAARRAGVTDENIAEALAHVALNVYSNTLARLAEPELDFPEAPSLDQ